MFKIENPTKANPSLLLKNKIASLEEKCRSLLVNQHKSLYHRMKEILDDDCHVTKWMLCLISLLSWLNWIGSKKSRSSIKMWSYAKRHWVQEEGVNILLKTHSFILYKLIHAMFLLRFGKNKAKKILAIARIFFSRFLPQLKILLY